MHTRKNYLRTFRKKLGLNQRQLAALVGLSSSSRISAMELGHAIPTARECLVFRLLFKRSFEELWPRVALQVEIATDVNIRRLMAGLEQGHARPERKRTRNSIIQRNLETLIKEDLSAEDLTDAE